MVNPYRNSEEYYDVHSAYMLIKSIGPEVGVYDFSEEILANDFVFSRQGMCNLVNALSSTLSNKKFCIAIYTCEPLIFTVGFANECFFIVDTHPIPTDIRGKGTEFLKYNPIRDRRGNSMWRSLPLDLAAPGFMISVNPNPNAAFFEKKRKMDPTPGFTDVR